MNNTEIIRVSSEDHAYIMEVAHIMDKSAKEVVSHMVSSLKRERGEMSRIISERKHYENPYFLPVAINKKIKRRVLPTDDRLRKDIDHLPCLADGLKDSDTIARKPYWLKTEHWLTKAISFLAGYGGVEIKREALPFMEKITSYDVEVEEESDKVFLPVNETAKLILMTISAITEKKIEKEYFNQEDLFLLHAYGYNISYKEKIVIDNP